MSQVDVSQNTLPTYLCSSILLRRIFIRESVDVVHGHSAFSTLCHEALLLATTMCIPIVFTDHSLFGLADLSAVIANAFLRFTLTSVPRVICVSNTAASNTRLRAHLPASRVDVIPNAIDADLFTPATRAELESRPAGVTVMVVSRLVYRKGTDLLVAAIPRICAAAPNVRFVIVGDGPKRVLLEEMVDRELLHSRVALLGVLPHRRVRDVLVTGHIFLNCSLTEAFCMAVVEAASCGLLVVSTDVGGVHEVLPADMMLLARPCVSDVVDKTLTAIRALPHAPDAQQCHNRIRAMYSWDDVAARTELVYAEACAAPPMPISDRLLAYRGIGTLSGLFFCVIAVLMHAFVSLC